MSISDEVLEAAAKAIGKVAHTRDFTAMAEAALEAAMEPTKEEIEAVLSKHFPLIEDWLDGGYQIVCDATGCECTTDIGPYGAVMSQWNGHIAGVLSIRGNRA